MGGLTFFFLLLPLLLCSSSFFAWAAHESETVEIKVSTATAIARTDHHFVCATIDWWPPEKCNYGMCPWGKSSLLNLDLDNPILFNALKVFGSVRIRLGGSLQDQVLYQVGSHPPECPNFNRNYSEMFGFTKGCLTMARWNELNTFFRKTGSILTFGLNALSGRTKSENNLYVGDWDPRNAFDLIKYTIARNFSIESWEFGNEICGTGVEARVKAKQYGKDLITLKKMISKLYKHSNRKPKLLAPGGFYNEKWFSKMLESSGAEVVNAVTHHIYNLGPGVDDKLIDKMQDPFYLSQISQTYFDIVNTIRDFGPWSSLWVSEAGGAYNSGGKDVSNAFVDSFWYLDQLGMVSAFNHKVFCRQALIGGNYALLDTETYVPNPDYYSALLWHKLMGPEVLETTHEGSPYLRSYTHCSKHKPGFTLLLINLSNSTKFDILVTNDMNLYPAGEGKLGGVQLDRNLGVREEYHLTPKGRSLKSRVMLLNGKPLRLIYGIEIPRMQPLVRNASVPLRIAPHSIVFARFKSARAPACED